MNAQVSIIIPVYNVNKYIVKCIQSVVNQDTNVPLEIILIDDCGSDNSISLAKEFASEYCSDNRIFKFINHPHNKGQGAARNNGVRSATGKFIFFIDSDDYLEPNCISSFLNEYQRDNADIIEGQNNYCSETGEIIKSSDFIKVFPNEVEIWQIGKFWKPVCWNKLISREFFIKNNLWFIEDVFYEDLHWATIVALAQPRIKCTPLVTYNYLVRTGSTTHILSQKHEKSFPIILKSLRSIFLNAQHEMNTHERICFIAQFERIRSIAIDLIVPEIDNKKSYVSNIQRYRLSHLFNILANKHLTLKLKIKLFPLYCGKLGTPLIKCKSYISRSLKKN